MVYKSAVYGLKMEKVPAMWFFLSANSHLDNKKCGRCLFRKARVSYYVFFIYFCGEKHSIFTV